MAVFPGTFKFKHGLSGYNNYGCRCDVCKKAKSEHTKKRKERLKNTEPPEHGTSQSYSVYGCRCDICVSARANSRKKYKEFLNGKEPPNHGLTGYSIYGCRCDICIKARKDNDKKRLDRPEVWAKEKERSWIKYGIKNFTYEDFCKMHEKQNGKCAICNTDIKKKSDKKMEIANVDHNHNTGKVRALLCNPCNKMLGCGGGVADTLRKGADYLDFHSKGDD